MRLVVPGQLALESGARAPSTITYSSMSDTQNPAPSELTFKSPQERQAFVINLRKEGYSNADIGRTLGITSAQVTTDVQTWVVAVQELMPPSEELFALFVDQLMGKMQDWQRMYREAQEHLKMAPRNDKAQKTMALATTQFLAVQKQLAELQGIMPKAKAAPAGKKEVETASSPQAAMDLFEEAKPREQPATADDLWSQLD